VQLSPARQGSAKEERKKRKKEERKKEERKSQKGWFLNRGYYGNTRGYHGNINIPDDWAAT